MAKSRTSKTEITTAAEFEKAGGWQPVWEDPDRFLLGHIRWEYARVVIKAEQDPVLLLNEYGADRWEAVSIDQYNGVAWMKRQTL